ncbi:MAG: prepilin-type N-terminal cleavage/methylation domain-containing protein [Bacillota bacterium]|nr:prepilin-type N-terminal cleavage/methylation domain-containing protein [Bacillota bacterium]
MNRIFNNRKGVTLLELIIALAIVGLVLTLAFNLFFFGNEIFAKGSDQYEVQHSVRLSLSSVTNEIRYASTLYIENDKPDTFEDPYSYLYYENSSVYYSYIDTDDTRRTKTLGNDITSISFSKESDKLIEITLNGLEQNQSYEIITEVGLPNMSIKNNDIIGTSGTVLKFEKNSEIVNLSSTDELIILPKTDFTLYPNEERFLLANKDVDWNLVDGDTGNFILTTIDSKTASIKASSTVGDWVTVEAEDIDDPLNTRQVDILVIEETYTAEIKHSNDQPIIGDLDLLVNEKKTLKVFITPTLEEGITIQGISWENDFPNESTSYFASTQDLDNPDIVEIEGKDEGGNAKLEVIINLIDDNSSTTYELYDFIIVDVSNDIQYPELTSLYFDTKKVNLEPTFEPSILSYTVSGDTQEKLVATTIEGNEISYNPEPNINGKYDLSLISQIKITVTKDDKLRTYIINID